MGPYCEFCGHRCFVERVLPVDAILNPGGQVLMATCVQGANNDYEKTGYRSTEAINQRDLGPGTALRLAAVRLFQDPETVMHRKGFVDALAGLLDATGRHYQVVDATTLATPLDALAKQIRQR